MSWPLAAVLALFAPLSLETVLDDVRRNAPERQVRAASVDVARAEVDMAGAWEDPTIRVRAEELQPDAARPGQPLMTYMVEQPLNVFGRRGLAKRAARARLGAASEGLRRAEWDAQARAVALFFELWMADEMRVVMTRQIAAMERMRDAGKARYAAGLMMAHHDVLRAEGELASMQAELYAIETERAGMASMLATLRGRDPGEVIDAVVPPERGAVPPLPAVLDRVAAAPEVAAAEAMTREAEARRSLAKRMSLPMVMIGGMVESAPDEMGTTVGGEISFTVPFWAFDRQRNEVRAASAMVREAKADTAAMRAMSAADVRMAWARASGADRELEALEATALPRLRDAVASSDAAYRAGGANFLGLLESILALQDAEGRRLEAVVRREVALFELSRLTGAPVTKTEAQP